MKKIKDAPKECLNPEHKPAKHVVLDLGTYEHVCPGCGKKYIIKVPRITI